jgi:hypothetical protein
MRAVAALTAGIPCICLRTNGGNVARLPLRRLATMGERGLKGLPGLTPKEFPAGAFRMCSINRGPGFVYPINTLKRIKK